MKRNGFTLIELLVVIAIIALLLSIILPSLRKVKEQANIILCGSDQRQLVFGLTAYGNDNNGKLPVHPSYLGTAGGRESYHRPTELNFLNNTYTYPVDPSSRPDYHFAGRYLYNYLPTVDVFNCNVAPVSGDSPWPPQTSGLPANGTYGEFYRTGQAAPLHATYTLLWGYQGYNHDVSAFVDLSQGDYAGPRKLSDSNRLVVQDTLYMKDGGADNLLWQDSNDMFGRWLTPHRFRGAEKAVPYFVGEKNGEVPEVWLNAGYLDGHSEKFNSLDTFQCKNYQANMRLTRKKR